MQFREYLKEYLRDLIPDLSNLPLGFHLVGHVALLQLKKSLQEYANLIGEAVLEFDSRIKSVAISNRKVSKTVEVKVRKNIRELIIKNVSKMKTEEFIREVIDGKLQQKIRKAISKVYPLRHFEFRKTEVL